MLKRKCIFGVLLCAILLAFTNQVFAGSKEAPKKIRVKDKSIQISVSGVIQTVKCTPAPTGPNSWSGGSYVANWAACPNDITVEMWRYASGNKWSKKILNGTGVFLKDDGNENGAEIASIYTNEPIIGVVQLRGENEFGTTAAVISGAFATVVSNKSEYDADDWYNATGTNYSLPDGILAAGAVDVPWGNPIPVSEEQWIKVTFQSNGVSDILAYIPEPATLMLMAFGGLTLLKKRK